MKRFHLILALAGITVGNVSWSAWATSPVLRHATDLRIGDRVPELAEGPDPCVVRVAFQSDCAYCAAAAARERARTKLLPTRWVGHTGDEGAAGYDQRIHPESRVVISDAAFASMKVEAVPVAVLVDSDGWIKRTWPYRGDEDVAALREACTTPTSPRDGGSARGE